MADREAAIRETFDRHLVDACIERVVNGRAQTLEAKAIRKLSAALDELAAAVRDAQHRHATGDSLAFNSTMLAVTLRQAEAVLRENHE